MIKNTAKMYNQQGGLNGIWVAIEEANYQEQHELEMHRKHLEIDREFNNKNFKSFCKDTIEFFNEINVQKQMCRFVRFRKELEDSYSFLKAHSDTPENLELAREVLKLNLTL